MGHLRTFGRLGLATAVAVFLMGAVPAHASDQLPSTRTIKVPVYGQAMSLDCEATALQMALASRGHWYSQRTLVSLQRPDYRRAYVDSRGRLRWGNPYTHFVGSPTGSESNLTGYGVYYPVVLNIARTHGAPNATGYQGYLPSQIYREVALGHPVQVWVEYHWLRPRMRWYLTFDATRWIRFSTLEHSVLLTGVSPTSVRVNDPAGGRQYWVSKHTFELSWLDFGNQAVIYR